NVTMDAEDLLLRELLGISDPRITAASANWIRENQRDDGTWATFHGGPPDLSTTVEAYWALKLAGDSPDEPHMQHAARHVVAAGGLEGTRVFTRIWLAMFGLWSWDELPVLPPELVLAPRWVPLNIYDFASWARQTIVPLTVVGAHRPVRATPVQLEELRTGAARPEAEPRAKRSAGRAFQRLDRLMHRYERRPLRRLRRLAIRRAERWIISRQEADGSWGGIQPPWVYSIIALHLLGHHLDDPVMRAALEGLERFTIWERDGELRRIEACQSPVWDTALAVVALVDAGVAPTEPQLARAAEWLLDEEITVRGDWSVRRPHLAPGGWAFEFANDRYPDVDDTAEVVLALARLRDVDPVRIDAAVHRAVRWTEGMQCRGGGFAAFDVDNDTRLPTLLPFCDFGAVTDPPSADVTAHVVEMLGHLQSAGRAGCVDRDVLARAVAWLSTEQEHDGSWFGRWGANHVYGTGAAVPALIAAGASTQDHRVVAAVAWLESVQNDDGGWGEDLRSYTDPAHRGRGSSTPSQTAWALLALLSAHRFGEAMRRGVTWLIQQQRADGSWDEPWFTGTGFPRDFYINYHLYRLVFPITALGRYLNALEAGDGDG
ncbi:MAG: putative squalene-hopene cyclase, partial [Ilumatobacteraceae bacterium]|nr:putative squalene-hopene cyclase [Ilumatobacteraceae bacterium]